MARMTQEQVTAHEKRMEMARKECSMGPFGQCFEALSQVLPVRQNVTKLTLQPTTDEAGLNKLERRYLAYLRTLNLPWIGVQCWTVKLGHDCRLTPDFFVLTTDGQLEALDTKAFNKKSGKMLREDDSTAKMAVAARTYPFIYFYYVHNQNDSWVRTLVKP